MPRGALAVVILCLGALFGHPESAQAVRIDPDLRSQFADKGGDARLPVLMIFAADETPVAYRAEKLPALDPVQRRLLVTGELKRRALRRQARAAEILVDPRFEKAVAGVHHLYLANAIAFEATWPVVAALGDLAADAVLVSDRAYDMTAATRRGVGSAPRLQNVAAVDTVWSVKYIGADRVWRDLGYDGSGVLVAHIDTGVWLAHPDLAGRLWVNPGEIAGNGLDDDGNGFIDDVHGWDFGAGDNDPNDDSPTGGHGTHTAGSVVGDGSGGILTGVAPGAQLMALKVWREDGTGASLGTLWAAQQYAIEQGARIITMSLGFSGEIPEVFMRAERYNGNNIRDAGVVFFNSAGNDHQTQTPPTEVALTARVPAPWNALSVPHSSTSGVIAVGGTGYKDDSVYVASSRGPATWGAVGPWHDWPLAPGPGLIKPDLAAPGVQINSTVLGGGYSGDTWHGTSMACPHVAGVAALMLQKNPTLSPAGVDSLLELNAVDLGVPGKDNETGSGRVDAYAAVSAVPSARNPDLVWVSVLPDPAGDAVIDAGLENEIAFSLRNVSPIAAAGEVTARLAVRPNPWVTVAAGDASFGSIAAGGGTADNTADAFRLQVAAEAPQGFPFTVLLTVAANDSYQQTFDIPWYVGLPDWRTHDLGGIYLTVTDQGSLGYMSQNQVEGRGLGFQAGASNLFVGSFWAGVNVDYVCNRDYNGLGTEAAEWIVSDAEPNGRVRNVNAADGRQEFTSVFTDGGHAAPRSLLVEQTTRAYGAPENQHFVIVEYTLRNMGPTDMPELFNGVFCDFDVGDSAANYGGSDAARNLTYMYEEDGNYIGIALLGAGGSAQNLTLINNPVYVYPTSAIDDGNKMRLLRGRISEPVATEPDDWSALTSTVVDLPGQGGEAVVAYALVVGSSLDEIQAAVDAANRVYAGDDPDGPDLPQAFGLAQNVPNPFNPFTQIDYIVPRAGFVDLAIYDLKGRRLRTLVNEAKAEGDQTAYWDGRDENGQALPSGLYFYKYVTADRVTARKMTLLR